MTALVVVLMVVLFVALDALVRLTTRRMARRAERLERERVLHTALRLDVSHEARTLKRAEVGQPKARILAVDDETVVLDSLRRILVLEGYSVDTVENGPEALGLLQRKDYDFVFTDLKMPGMDGVEVVKAAHHLRPDVDLAVITGYATIESAVETMQHGAVAYVQKPFTAEELATFVRELLIKRQARLEAQRQPAVRIVSPAMAADLAGRDYCVPGGAFIAPGHVWARIEPDGRVRVGLDDFARKALGSIESVELPKPDSACPAAGPLFAVRRRDRMVHFPCPVGGRVAQVNTALSSDPRPLNERPYDDGWICVVAPTDLTADLPHLKIGQPLVAWYQDEIARLRDSGGPAEKGTPAVDWRTFEARFAQAAAPARA